MRLGEPSWLMLLVLGVLPWAWSRRRRRLAWPTLSGFEGLRAWPARWRRGWPEVARGLAVACLAVALARPQEPGGRVHVAGKGVAIVAVVDRSSSMNTADFPAGAGAAPVPRLEAAKATLARFVEARSDDLVGVVAFAALPDLVVAPTLDQAFLLDAVRSIRPAGRVDDGTDLGDAVAWALGAIRDASPRRKVVILLTDGRNAPTLPDPVAPVASAELARGLGATLHTIAIGKPPRPEARPDAEDPGPDVDLLRRMAEAGGGRSFVAADADALGRVFAEIDGLEKSPVSGTVRTIYRERFAPWVAAALALLAVDLALTSGRFRRLP